MPTSDPSPREGSAGRVPSQTLSRADPASDHAAALDAVISLKTSSAMVGGKRLAGIAEKLQSLIQTGDLHSGQALLPVVADSGRATVNELNLRYILKNR